MQKTSNDGAIVFSAMLRWKGVPVCERRAGDDGRLTVGSGRGADLQVPEEAGAGNEFPLLVSGGGLCEVNVPSGWTVRTSRHELEEPDVTKVPRRSKLLGSSGRCILMNGSFEIEVVPVKPRPLLRQRLIKSLDRRFAGFLALAAAITVLMTVFSLFVYSDAQTIPEHKLVRSATYIDIFRKPADIKKIVEFNPKVIESERKPVEKPGSKSGMAVSHPVADRRSELKKAMNAGILGAIAGAGGPTKSIFNPGGIGASINDAIGGLVGPKYGSAGGLEGLTPRSGPEGGGGPLSIGSIYGPGGRVSKAPDLALAPGKKDEAKVEGGGLVMEGGLDKEVVGRVIRMHLNQARYCYEKELSKNPGISGKVTIQFVIGTEGRVESSHVAETMMNNGEVEECLERKVRSWEFPRPRGGGQVIVTYPFLFTSAGAP